MTPSPGRTATGRSPGRGPTRGGFGMAVMLVAGCAACCAGPLLAALGAITATSAVAALFVPVLVVLGVAAATTGVVVVAWRRRKRQACGDRTDVIDLPEPTVRRGAPDQPPARLRADESPTMNVGSRVSRSCSDE